ncbi:MAG: RagB/SusD family nutrient uptake outer membrane protein [Bacteroidales bacterium]|jgi:hypothetical protein|nr:RagB/SusD family nutrient uptake outer membrane protein [Bacteroidales bacterium]
MNHILQFKKYFMQVLAGMMLCSVTFSSCDYLNIDQYLDEEMNMDTVFARKRYIEAYMWDAAGRFQDEGAIFGSGLYTPGPMATDEAFCLFGASEFQGMGYVLGQYTPDNPGNIISRWGSWYKIIRQCNTIFARIDEAKDWTATERLRILGYTRFIRAYAYYNLLLNFGPPILLGDEMLENNEEITYYDRPRDLYDEAMEYVCTELEAAAPFLPDKVGSVLEYGRPTKGAAYALVARLRLLHASPLFNGGAPAKMYFGNWTRKTDGKHYISQTPDPRRWAVAAAAAKRVMDMKHEGLPMYSLHTVTADASTPPLPVNIPDPDYTNTFPDGADGIDHYKSYADMFDGETVMNVNPEFIWARTSSSLTSYTRHSFPVANGGWNGMCVTQKIVDAYEMVDGRTISDSSTDYPYDEQGYTTSPTSFSGYSLNAGVFNMYVNREKRFYASVGFSECVWPNLSTTDNSQKNLTITYYYDSPNGRSGAPNPNDHPITGYVLKKYVHPSDAWAGENARRVSKAFPIIRYAEILMGYAEALNNLGSESYTVDLDDGNPQTFSRDAAEIKKAFNQIRYRAGLPGLTDADAADANLVMSKIKKERMIEFMFENHRYFDVRRWGDYEESESEPIRGMNTSATRDTYYQRVIPNSNRVGNRIIHRKFLFVPIPKTELRRLPSLDQNPGW